MAALALVMGPSAWSAAPEIPGVLEMDIGVQSSQHSKVDSRLALAEIAVSLQLSAKVPAKSCRKTKKEKREMVIMRLSLFRIRTYKSGQIIACLRSWAEKEKE